MSLPDIDIDFAKPNLALDKIKHIKASILDKKTLTKHNSGIYMTDIPIDPETNLSAIPYKEAEERGYFKIDFLSLSVYEKVKSEDHLISLMNTIPLWEILSDKDLVSDLFQIKDQFDIVDKIKPKSVEELAIVIALIRPAKRYLLNHDINYIKEHIWKKDDSGFYFKKSHAISYAMVILIQMNLMIEELQNDE